MNHNFIFSNDDWLGEGTIRLSMSEEPLHFVTRWKRHSEDPSGIIEVIQEVQIKGINEIMINHFTFSKSEGKNIEITLENNTVGKVEGKGVVNPAVIGWEFNNPEVHFQGFEFYEKQNDDQYLMRGEYSSDDDYRTFITGKIWKKNKV
jgi:hypothetical protein